MTEPTDAPYSTTSQEELLKELAVISIMHSLTGKVDAQTFTMLIQTALVADTLLREKEEREKSDEAAKKLQIDLQSESFAKDIEIASLRAQLDNRTL